MENQKEREQSILTSLVQEIPAMLREEQIEEPVYGVLLIYSTNPQDALLPWIAVGTQRERAAILQQVQEPDLLMWDGEALEYYNPVQALEENADFLDLCEQWKTQAASQGGLEGKITALMQRICFALQQVPWEQVFPITNDFVVAACTPEGDWLQENMSVLLPPEKYQALVEKGYLLPSCGGCITDAQE